MAKRILKNIRKNGDEYEVGNIKTYTITEDITTVTTEATAGVSPYDTSYGYTNITIDENSGIKWKEGAIYSFVVNTEMVVASDKRNVRVRIGSSGSWIPLMNKNGTILNGNEYMQKANTLLFVYKTNYQSTGALHINNQEQVSDTAYASSWNGVTTIAPSKNAVYDKISAMDTTISGKADSSSLATVATSGSYADLSNKPTIPVVDSALSTTSTNALQNKVITDALNGKLDGFTRMFAGNWSGGVHPVRFVRVDYSTANSENGIFIKMSLVNSHGNGQAGRFLEDVILLVTYTGSVECSIYRYFGTQTNVSGDYYYNSYGDIFWTIDTTNKIVDFFVLMHQFSYTRMTPYFRLNRSTGGVITQAYEGSGNPEYSSGTKSRATIYDYSKIPSKTSQLTNDSGFIDNTYHDSSKYDASNPNGYTSNQGTITGITMNGSSKGTSGVVNLGTVITSHQSIKTINGNTMTGSGNVSINAVSDGGTTGQVLTKNANGYGWADSVSNVKVFEVASATAANVQDAVDWYNNGGVPIIKIGTMIYGLVSGGDTSLNFSLIFVDKQTGTGGAAGYLLRSYGLSITVSNGTATSVTQKGCYVYVNTVAPTNNNGGMITLVI